MDFEKAYEEALERAKELHKAGNALTKLQIEVVFPELKESEDERIREQIEQALIEHDWSATYKVSKDDCLAYLERQKDKVVKFDHDKEQKPAEWSEEDEKMFNSLCTVLRGGLSSIPTEQFISWLKSLRPQSKQEWSEKEKGILLECVSALQNSGNWLLADKLSSLCPQPHWKPSEEQMEALDNARFCKSYNRTELDSLYHDLQKLL